MAQSKSTTNFEGLLFQFMDSPDPMLCMLEWLCSRMMEAEVSSKLRAEKHEQSEERTSHRCGFRPRRLDTRLGTMYLLVPKVRNGGYIPFFVTERKRSEAALVQVVQEAFVQGVSTRGLPPVFVPTSELVKFLRCPPKSGPVLMRKIRGLNRQTCCAAGKSGWCLVC